MKLSTENFSRYRDLANLLWKYGGSFNLDEESYSEDEVEIKGKSFASDLEKLGPTYVKLGQLLSTRPDLVPEGYLSSLERLQDNVNQLDFDEIKVVVESELGGKIENIFEYFEHTPLASASLAQVHKATTRSGRSVVVKVQRPKIQKEISKDLNSLSELAKIIDNTTEVGKRYEFSIIVETLTEVLKKELDYSREFQNLLTLRKNLKNFKSITIPEPIADLSTEKVLTMDYLPSVNLTAVNPVVLIEKNGSYLAKELFKAYFQQIVVDGFFHADPHPGNVLLNDDDTVAILDLGMVGFIPPEHRSPILRMLLAISSNNAQAISDATIEVATKRESFDRQNFVNSIQKLLLKHNKGDVSKLETGKIILDIQKVSSNCGLRLSNGLTILGKALLSLDKVISILDPNFNPAKVLQEFAPEILLKRSSDSVTMNNLYDRIIRSEQFVEKFPKRINSILDNLSQNNLTITLDGVEEQRFIRAIQKIANRITTGLMLSSMVITSGLLMDMETDSTILGYPTLAVLLLTISAGGSIYLIIRSMFNDT